MSVLVIEDQAVSQLAPATIARPAFNISCGGVRLIELLAELGPPLTASVRPHLRAMLEADSPGLAEDREVRLLISARLAPSLDNLRSLQKLIANDRPCVVRDQQHMAAALLSAPRGSSSFAAPWSGALPESLPEADDLPLQLLHHPHDIVRENLRLLPEHLQARISSRDYRQERPDVFLGEDVRIGEHAVLDASGGPIVIEAGASIGPHSYVAGPALIGANTRLIEHAAIKDSCCIGHTVKIGGEVEASVIEPYSNKQHYGFLGHSYLGSWINLGAGTCNSDLKNTYGEINMDYGGARVASGMQFMGCVIGDYAKSAINTGIFTGKTIGVCSMVYGFVTTNVPSFVNYARLFGQINELPPDVMIATQRRMFQRRQVEQRECDIQLIRDMYELTMPQRQATGEPLLEP